MHSASTASTPRAPLQDTDIVKRSRQDPRLEPRARIDAGEPSIQPRSIAVLIGQLGHGGTERQLYMFLDHCDRRLWAPVVYVSGGLGRWATPIRALDIPVVPLSGGPLAKMRQLRSACIDRNTRCFFSWSSYTNGFAMALAGCGVHCIGSFRNQLFADLPTRWRGLWSWGSMAAISTAVCNSQETFFEIARRSRPALQPIFVPNAVEALSPERVQACRENWRARLGLNDDALLVLGVGRLARQKQFARFVRVVARVAKSRPLRAVIAGKDFGCLAELEALLGGLGLQDTVRLIGEVPDARELMCAADIFLLSSDHEGMPNVVLEAMAAGVPCVAAKVNGVADLIRHGATGFIGERDADDLARHVLSLASNADLRRAMGSRARTAIGQRHEPERVARQLWSLCEPPNAARCAEVARA